MDYPLFKQSVCKRIKELRLEKGLTQEEISGLNMGVRTYQKIESGESAPSLESLFIIAETLGLHPKELLNVPMDGKKRH
ncbi:helix-turn-helix transcriptional regulator [Leptospira ellisii]|uniref:Transcriptional regulator n=1 Tax=Leptospira ellisii TaxID=2023197 RepID=A0A2N0BQN5_9LEPT|nr:helix-turn-helix transcriptional regulator [Leptospira ellisii]MDV6237147.1 helix-turn-helix transcriptional regulator [Leptospira ellisii]PJZ93441.1 transcriptional regulator [Leptospira ellisii]PKA06309.1 transcriptional regulator [Leptospira ellisii]